MGLLPDISRYPDAGRATRAVIDLDAFEGNIRTLRTYIGPAVELTAVVKANAYGHGAPMMAAAAVAAGADRLAVATVAEGAQLRSAGVTAPVIVLGAVGLGEAEAAIEADLEVTIGTTELLDAIAAAAAREQRQVRVHVKVDTGLRRYGAYPELAAALARRVAANPSLALEGLFTHFATSEDDGDPFAAEQFEALRAVVEGLAAEGIAARRVHAANSGGMLGGSAFHAGAVRPGIAIYGIAPSADRPLLPGMRPVLTLRSRLVRVFALSPGDTVGYGRTFRAGRPMLAGLVPIGYADGYRRQLSGRSWMAVRGARAPVLGRVSMDQTVVELPVGPEHRLGEEVVVAGADPDGVAPTMDLLGEIVGTNSYEMLVGIAARVPRHYVRGGELVAVAEGLPV